MRSILMVPANVLGHEPVQVVLVQDNHVIEQFCRQLPTQRSATPFCQGLRKAVRTGELPISFIENQADQVPK